MGVDLDEVGVNDCQYLLSEFFSLSFTVERLLYQTNFDHYCNALYCIVIIVI